MADALGFFSYQVNVVTHSATTTTLINLKIKKIFMNFSLIPKKKKLNFAASSRPLGPIERGTNAVGCEIQLSIHIPDLIRGLLFD